MRRRLVGAMALVLAGCNLITGVDDYEKCARRGCDADDEDDDDGSTASSGGEGGAGGAGQCAAGESRLTLTVVGEGFSVSDTASAFEVTASPGGAFGSACLRRGQRTLRASRDGADLDTIVWGVGCTAVAGTPARCAYLLDSELSLGASAP